MDVVNLRWRETVELKIWILCVQRVQQIFVPFNPVIRMQSSLHQHACAAQRDRLVDLRADLVNSPDVSVGGTRPAIESTKGADDVADVGVVYIPVDYVGDDVAGVAALANLVGSRADPGNFVRLKQSRAFVSSQALASERAIEDRLNISRCDH